MFPLKNLVCKGIIIRPQVTPAGICTQQWSNWMNRIKYRATNLWYLLKIMVLWERTLLHQCLGHPVIFPSFCGQACCCVTNHLAFVYSDGSKSILYQPIKNNVEKIVRAPGQCRYRSRGLRGGKMSTNEFTTPQLKNKFDSKYMDIGVDQWLQLCIAGACQRIYAMVKGPFC